MFGHQKHIASIYCFVDGSLELLGILFRIHNHVAGTSSDTFFHFLKFEVLHEGASSYHF